MAKDDFDLEVVDDSKASFGSQVWFVLNALLIVLPPVYLYHALFGIDVNEQFSIYLYGAVSLTTAVILAYSYQNVAYWLSKRLLAQRDGVITQQVVLVAYGEAKDKVKENTERAKNEQKSNTLGESSAFAILYNNLFFLVAFLTIAFYILPNVPGPYNYAISVLSSASLVAFVSQEALKRA